VTAQDRVQHDVAAELARDVDANFERFVGTYQHRVFALALNLLADAAAAEEVAQETFVAAYRALKGYQPSRRRELSIRAWLATIVLNRVRNRARGAKRAALSLDDESVRARLPSERREEPDAQVLRGEEKSELRAALGRLAPRYREPVVLRHIDGYGYSEIAELLRQPIGTVKANVNRGLAKLRADYESRQYRAQ